MMQKSRSDAQRVHFFRAFSLSRNGDGEVSKCWRVVGGYYLASDTYMPLVLINLHSISLPF